MKKKLIIIISSILTIIALIIIYLNRTVATITLDINPSIKIFLKKNNIVKYITPLNTDAKKVINKEYNGITLKKALEEIVNNIVELDYIEDRQAVVLVGIDGNMDKNILSKFLTESFDKLYIHSDIIIVDNITDDDIKISKKYNITPAKASYINKIVNDNNLKIDDIVTESISEVIETRDTGNYCVSDYKLDHGRCIKEIGEEKATWDKICPEGYYDYNGTCYLETAVLEKENYICRDGFRVENDKCINTITINALGNYKCDTGKLIKRGEAYREYRDQDDYEEMICADESTGVKPTERCLAQEHIIVDGKCGMGPKPLLPTATGCTPEDTNINGACYDFNHKDEYVCPTSGIYDTADMICPETITYNKATLINYYCEDDYKLVDDKCIKEEVEDAIKERYCPDGYTKLENDKCINYNNTTNHIDGYKCEVDGSKIINDKCILLDIKEPKHN